MQIRTMKEVPIFEDELECNIWKNVSVYVTNKNWLHLS